MEGETRGKKVCGGGEGRGGGNFASEETWGKVSAVGCVWGVGGRGCGVWGCGVMGLWGGERALFGLLGIGARRGAEDGDGPWILVP